MMIRRLALLLLSAVVVQGFQNAAPFLMLSTESFNGILQSREIASARHIQDEISSVYEKEGCKADTHIVVVLPGLTAADSRQMPKLGALAQAKGYRGRMEIPNVVGEIDWNALQLSLGRYCNAAQASTIIENGQWPLDLASKSGPTVAVVNSESLPNDKMLRAKRLASLDASLDKHFGKAAELGSHVLMIVSTPATAFQEDVDHVYEMDESYLSTLHGDLKRDVAIHRRASNSSDNMQDGLPLFEKYQYLSPGIFMGLSVTLLLFLILYVGISAIAGLDVSYMAFSKEMVPQAQKGKQQ